MSSTTAKPRPRLLNDAEQEAILEALQLYRLQRQISDDPAGVALTDHTARLLEWSAVVLIPERGAYDGYQNSDVEHTEAMRMMREATA